MSILDRLARALFSAGISGGISWALGASGTVVMVCAAISALIALIFPEIFVLIGWDD
jgi:hypothetical protein